MIFDKIELLLLLVRVSLEQFSDRSQAISTVSQGFFAGGLEFFGGVFSGKRLQADEYADGLDASRLRHRLSPLARVMSDQVDAFEHSLRAPFHRGELLLGDVLRRSAKATWLRRGMNEDGLPVIVEDANQVTVPTHPKSATNVFRRSRIVRFVDFEMTVSIHRSSCFLETGKAIWW